MIFVYFSNNYTYRQSGSVQKSVVCVQCGKQYYYQMQRTAIGRATSPYWLNEEGADRKARERAASGLQKMLATSCDVVPCPECNTLQPDMARRMRKRCCKWLNSAAVALIAIGFIVGVFGLVAASGDYHVPRKDTTGAQATVIKVAAAIIAAGVMCVPARLLIAGMRYPTTHAGAPNGS